MLDDALLSTVKLIVDACGDVCYCDASGYLLYKGEKPRPESHTVFTEQSREASIRQASSAHILKDNGV